MILDHCYRYVSHLNVIQPKRAFRIVFVLVSVQVVYDSLHWIVPVLVVVVVVVIVMAIFYCACCMRGVGNIPGNPFGGNYLCNGGKYLCHRQRSESVQRFLPTECDTVSFV